MPVIPFASQMRLQTSDDDKGPVVFDNHFRSGARACVTGTGAWHVTAGMDICNV